MAKSKSRKISNLVPGDRLQLEDGRVATVRFCRPSRLFEAADDRAYEISWRVGNTIAESIERGSAAVKLAN